MVMEGKPVALHYFGITPIDASRSIRANIRHAHLGWHRRRTWQDHRSNPSNRPTSNIMAATLIIILSSHYGPSQPLPTQHSEPTHAIGGSPQFHGEVKGQHYGILNQCWGHTACFRWLLEFIISQLRRKSLATHPPVVLDCKDCYYTILYYNTILLYYTMLLLLLYYYNTIIL